MRYYKIIESGKLLAIGKGPGGTEITEAEYNSLLAMIREKAALVNQLYSNEITIDDVPIEWQEEIQRRVDERRANEPDPETEEIPGDEFLNMMEGVL